MIGGTVGEVVESRHPQFQPGDPVLGTGGWQEYSVVNAGEPDALRKVGTAQAPLSYYLGAMGMPGVTAWYGLVKIIEPKVGQTVTVSAATGAVGSAFAALAKARGCRAVGIAGGPDKCKYAVEELGFDACIDHRQHPDFKSMSQALKQACPDGIDGHFENVGGHILDAVLLRANAFARIAICGMVAGYDGAPLPLQHPALILTNRVKMQGFIVGEHKEVWPPAEAELAALVASGKLRPRETIAQGLESAPEAFLGLLKGKNFGKQLVRLI
jgi:NADPH-dependent curcumin reductase CurA